MNWEVEIKRGYESDGSAYYDLYINGKLRYCTDVFMNAVERAEEIRAEFDTQNA